MIKFFMNTDSPEACLAKIQELQDENVVEVLETVQFTSSRKKSSIVVRYPAKEGTDEEVRVYSKGAPDWMIESNNLTEEPICSQMMNEDGEIVELDEDLVKRVYGEFGEKTYRTLLFAYKDMSMETFNELKDQYSGFATDEDKDAIESELIAYAIIGIMDPLRDRIAESVQVCQRAGIKVVMCTGDNIVTAKAIALKAGILDEKSSKKKKACMTGAEFEDEVGGLRRDPMFEGDPADAPWVVRDKRSFDLVIKDLRVLARSSPAQKHILVTGLQQNDECVAVTGDGTNDTQAVLKADVGFAMNKGSDILKGVADMVLLDNNFCSILVALKYGRNVYDNVRKFLQY